MIEAFEELCRKLEVPPTQANVWLIEDEFSRQLSSSQSRLSEAVKVLEEAKHLLQDISDGVVVADGRGDDGIIDMQIVRDIEAFLADIGEET